MVFNTRNSLTKAIPVSRKIAVEIQQQLTALLNSHPLDRWANQNTDLPVQIWSDWHNNSTTRKGVRGIRIRTQLYGTFSGCPNGSGVVQNTLNPNSAEVVAFHQLVIALDSIIKTLPDMSYRMMVRPSKNLKYYSTRWQVTIWYQTKNF